jgi:hypothetical protein
MPEFEIAEEISRTFSTELEARIFIQPGLRSPEVPGRLAIIEKKFFVQTLISRFKVSNGIHPVGQVFGQVFIRINLVHKKVQNGFSCSHLLLLSTIYPYENMTTLSKRRWHTTKI